MLKHFHSLFGRRNAIDLNKSFDSLEDSGSGMKTRKDKMKSKKDKKKRKKRSYEPSHAELTEKVAATPPAEDAVNNPSQSGSHSPTCLKQKSRKISLETFFNHSSGRRSRTISKLSSTFTEDFWVRHFSGRRFAPWQEFRAAFLGDYGALIEDFAPERTHWILAIVHEDIFRDMDDVYRCYYEKFCQKHEEGDRLWLSIKEYASERIFREGVVESMFE